MSIYYEKGKTAPNQDLITIGPHKKLTKDFIQVSKEDFAKAAKLLKDGRGTPNGGALILYMYLKGNAEGWQMGLSPKALQEELGLGESAYNTGKKLLIDKGFLVETNKHHYTFYEDGNQNRQNDGFNDTSSSLAKTGVSNALSSNKTSDSNVLPPIKTSEPLREIIYNKDKIEKINNSSAAVAAPLPLISYEEAATRAKKVSIYDPFAKKLAKAEHPYPGKPILYFEGEYYEPVGEIFEE